MKRILILVAAALAIAGCGTKEAPTMINEAVPNITAVDANAMPEDAKITDVPEDDGDAAATDSDTTAAKTVKTKTTKTEHK